MSRMMMGWRSMACMAATLTWLAMAAAILASPLPSPPDAAHPNPPPDQSIIVFKDVPIEYDQTPAEGLSRNGVVVRNFGQMIEATVDLPALPLDQRDARRIVATVVVKPVLTGAAEKARPGDPWTRAGSVRVLRTPSAGAGESGSPPATQPAQPRPSNPSPSQPASSEPVIPIAADEVELMRFITPFGNEATMTQDLTSLVPLLTGKRAIRIYLTSYKKPAWTVSFKLEYTAAGVGYRRPAWAMPLFLSDAVTAEQDTLRATIEVPRGLDRPRRQSPPRSGRPSPPLQLADPVVSRPSIAARRSDRSSYRVSEQGPSPGR